MHERYVLAIPGRQHAHRLDVTPDLRHARTADGVDSPGRSIGDGPPLVHMPGIPFSNVAAEWTIPALASAYEALGRRVRLIQYDGRGTGPVSATSPTSRSMAISAISTPCSTRRASAVRRLVAGLLPLGDVGDRRCRPTSGPCPPAGAVRRCGTRLGSDERAGDAGAAQPHRARLERVRRVDRARLAGLGRLGRGRPAGRGLVPQRDVPDGRPSHAGGSRADRRASVCLAFAARARAASA